jgi:hypothetical protein
VIENQVSARKTASRQPAFDISEKQLEVFSSKDTQTMEQHGLKIVNNCLNTNIYSYLETSGGQSFNLYSNVVNFFNTHVN